jgi:hypothetical protein
MSQLLGKVVGLASKFSSTAKPRFKCAAFFISEFDCTKISAGSRGADREESHRPGADRWRPKDPEA